ncbi:DNA polymerase III subunit delta [Castellaniella sp.]|uniref:DNA polymerase III subunit delta n=1 Tax=Castellaniella sp. TaxID=1955812 RepID=UPI002AFFEF64|nr:DNA polymerase III subunit delta [Castellaniella sp.]
MNSRAPDAQQLIDGLATGQALASCMVLSGDEILLVTEVADAYRAAAVRQGCSERTHLVMDARSDWSQALASARNTSLFGDLRLLEISLPTGKPGKTGSDALQQLAALCSQDQMPDLKVLIRLPALDRATQQGKWVQALKKQALWQDIPSIQRTALPDWIATRLARQQQDTSPETLAWLSDKVEGNLLAAHQEILKLALLHPAGHLTLEQVQAAVLNVARYNLYDLRDAMLAGQADRALTVLNGLRAEGEALVLVLWAVGEEIRIINRISADPNPDAAMRSQRVFGPRERLIRQALQRVPARTWPLALRHAHEIDSLIKGIPVVGQLTDPWDELARLTLRIATAGVRRH